MTHLAVTSEYKVAYQPNIEDDFRFQILEQVSPSMVSYNSEDNSGLFDLDYIQALIQSGDIKCDDRVRNFIEYLLDEGFDYVEL